MNPFGVEPKRIARVIRTTVVAFENSKNQLLFDM